MSSGIYLVNNGQLVEMKEQGYDSEELLQKLLAGYPNLLAGDQIDSTTPRRWLLISRESSVTDQESGASRWAIDHLFLDQDAVPTLVEAKRTQDSRVRHEIVGQMLEYAANARTYWSIEKVSQQFETNCKMQGLEPEQELVRLLGVENGIESFWQAAQANLQAGKVRLLFVSDVIQPELQRVIEFLNKQMNPAEVLGVEIKQFVGQGLQTLVPRVVGLNADAQQKKEKVNNESETRQWDETSFFQELEARRGQAEASIGRAILAWAKTNMPTIHWGKSKQAGSFAPGLNHNGSWHRSISVWTNGSIEVQFQYMKTNPPFNSEAKRLELLNKLNKIEGVIILPDSVNLRPTFPLSILKDETAAAQFFEVLDWFANEVKAN